MDEQDVIVGRVVRAHGLRGEVVVTPASPGSDVLFHVDSVVVDHRGQRTRRDVRRARMQGRALVLSIASIDDRNAAEALVGAELVLKEAELPPPDEGEFYVEELIGLPVVDPQGKQVGEIVGFEDGGLQSWLVVDVNGKQSLVPFTEPLIQIEDERIVLDAPEGLLDLDNVEAIREKP